MNELSFPEEYFKDEERDGFLVTECMKRYFAATLETLKAFERVCDAYSLKWWADWGTLLGAVRHAGFVPWDDDLDIGMLRNDYLKFLEKADELPEGYTVDSYDNPYHRYSGYSVLTNHRGTFFTPEILNDFHLCPFPAGFDLYVYDNCPDDEREQQEWRLSGIKYLLPMELIKTKGIDNNETKNALRKVGLSGNYKEEDKYDILFTLGKKVDEIAARYKDFDTKELVQYTFFIRDNARKGLKKSWYEGDLIKLPFENTEINSIKDPENILKAFYGEEFMTPVMGIQAHEYPLYKRDIINMTGFLEKGGMKLKDLPKELLYIKREADLREIPYQK